jgi:hypothetical protein
MTMSDWFSENSGGSGNPGVAFDAVGQKVVGTIISTPRPQETQYGNRLVVDITAVEGSTAVAGEQHAPIVAGQDYTIWVKPGAMARAIKDALTAAGAPGLQEGGVLAVAYSADGERKPGKNPPKLYTAQYKAVVAAVAVTESLI